MNPPSFIHPSTIANMIDFDRASLFAGEVGKGKKSAMAFEETQDPRRLYADVTANGRDKNQSRKLGVFLAPNGSVLIGTAYKNRMTPYVSVLDKGGLAGGIRYSQLTLEPGKIGHGYSLLASLKTKHPTKGFMAMLSPEDWARLSDDFRNRMAAIAETSEAIASISGDNCGSKVNTVGNESPIREGSYTPENPEREFRDMVVESVWRDGIDQDEFRHTLFNELAKKENRSLRNWVLREVIADLLEIPDCAKILRDKDSNPQEFLLRCAAQIVYEAVQEIGIDQESFEISAGRSIQAAVSASHDSSRYGSPRESWRITKEQQAISFQVQSCQ